MTRPRFIAEEVEVRFAEKPGPPSSFIWKSTEYKIMEILSARRQIDRRRAWWRRRHRDYYLVRTDTGQIFELYFHRGYGRRYWVLYKEL